MKPVIDKILGQNRFDFLISYQFALAVLKRHESETVVVAFQGLGVFFEDSGLVERVPTLPRLISSPIPSPLLPLKKRTPCSFPRTLNLTLRLIPSHRSLELLPPLLH